MQPAALPPPALTLLVPGLLWPEPALSDTVFDLPLPALQTLLGRSRLVRESLDETAWWSRWTKAPLAPAAYRLLVLDTLPEDDWLCADPVHLRFEQQSLVLEDPSVLVISSEESQRLAADIAPLMAEFGSLHLTTDRHWHFQPHDGLPPFPPLLASLTGQPARSLLPDGTENRPWRRLLNEIQMVLHQHPVNQAREAAGESLINNLALWGGGRLPDTVPAVPFTRLLSNEPFHAGLGRHWQIATDTLPDHYRADSGHTLAVCAQLTLPTLLRDAMNWREGLLTLEAQWFAPVLNALASGKLKNFQLVGFGTAEDTTTCLTATTTGSDRFKFWRRPRPLTELHP